MSAPIYDGGPAFPVHGGHGDDDPRNRIIGGGMTLRDWFAGQALAGLLANSNDRFEVGASIYAYAFADAMLAARAKGGDA